MKKLSLIALLFLLPSSIHAQLDKELWDLSNHLTELYIQLGTPTPLPPTPQPPIPVTVIPQQNITPMPTQSAWDQFLIENKAHEAKALQNQYPVFLAYIMATADGKFLTLQQAQAMLKAYNQACANFYTPEKLHMTLLYMYIPVEPNQITDETATVKYISDFLYALIDQFTNTLQPLNFEYSTIKILGRNLEYLVAAFNPKLGIRHIQEQFIMPFGKKLFQQFPNAWLSYIEAPLFHISLAKLQQTKCSAQDIKIPSTLPKIRDYRLKYMELQISVKGPTHKPYLRKGPTWKAQ